MAKFNEYGMEAQRDDGVTIVRGTVTALSLESAWHKAIAKAFEAVEPGTGEQPESITVYRLKSARDSHG